MSRRSFIITALVVNLTICITLCIVMFTGNESKANDNVREDEEAILSETRPGNQSIVNIEDISEVMSGDEDNIGQDESTTEKLIESQVQTDTQPYNYKSETSDENLIQGSGQREEETAQPLTTEPQSSEQIKEEQTVAVNGTVAVVKNGCNIRSDRDVGNNIMGTARAGDRYNIEPSGCTKHWIAIYVSDGQIGYISTTFCDIE